MAAKNSILILAFLLARILANKLFPLSAFQFPPSINRNNDTTDLKTQQKANTMKVDVYAFREYLSIVYIL